MKLLTIIGIFLTLLPPYISAQDCESLNDYRRKITQADSCILTGNYRMAQNHYNAAAKVYCEDKSTEVETRKKELFAQINKLRQDAVEAKARADSSTKIAQRDKQYLKKTIAEVVLLQLQQADQAILNLNYDTALVQTNRITNKPSDDFKTYDGLLSLPFKNVLLLFLQTHQIR